MIQYRDFIFYNLYNLYDLDLDVQYVHLRIMDRVSLFNSIKMKIWFVKIVKT